MPGRRLRWILAGALVLAWLGAGLSRISFNVDILRLLPTHLPQVEGLSLFLKYFSQPGELIVTVEAADSDTAAKAADALARELGSHPDLVKRAVSRAPWEQRPQDLAEILAFLLLNQPPDQIAALAARLSPEQAPAVLASTLDTLGSSFSPREIAMLSYDPYQLTGALDQSALFSDEQQSEFSSSDGAFRVVYVEAAHPFASYLEASKWIGGIRALAQAWKENQPVTVAFTGEPAFLAEISTSMQGDMMSSGFVTLAIIALIFWLCYRRLRPLLHLQLMLALIFLLSLATAGIFLSELTVIGAGFASVMIGLSVDYGYFVYARSLRSRGPVRALRRDCIQNIAWTASTTAAAFFALNLSSLPGLSQLGNLVGIGVIIGAFVMLGLFAQLTAREHEPGELRAPRFFERLFASRRFPVAGAWFTLALAAGLVAALFIKGFPEMDFSASVFRPRVSEAYPAMDRLTSRLTNNEDFLSLIVTGPDEAAVAARLRAIEGKLAAAVARGDALSYRSPLPLWPEAARQRENLRTLAPLAAEIPRLERTAIDGGFTDDALVLTRGVLGQFAAWAGQSPPIWPVNPSSEWMLRRIASRQPDLALAMGTVRPAPGREDAVVQALQDDGVRVVSWSQLGRELERTIPGEFVRVIIGLFAFVLIILAIGFRSLKAVLLFTATTGLVLVCLAGAMSLLGMTWSFFNLAAILLLLGTGTDYSILLLLALRRNGGDAAKAQQELGLVIALCCSSAAAGFGSISWANNAGLAALGQTCALGLVIDALISLFLLPRAWELLRISPRAG